MPILKECVTKLPDGDWKYGMYVEFSKAYYFYPYAKIRRTGKSIRECVPRADPNNETGRYQIFAQALRANFTVHQANRIAKNTSEGATYDADIYMGLQSGFIELTTD